MVYFEVTEMAFPFGDNRSWNEICTERGMADRRKEGGVLVGREGTTCLSLPRPRMKFACPGLGPTCPSWGLGGRGKENILRSIC